MGLALQSFVRLFLKGCHPCVTLYAGKVSHKMEQWKIGGSSMAGSRRCEIVYTVLCTLLSAMSGKFPFSF